MKLYSVAASTCDYDEYDEFVVWAKNAEEALTIAQKNQGYRCTNFNEGATVTELKKPKESGILLGSFNAG